MKALNFIVLIGIISLFADMTYEGARSITGPYLALLGANAATVGFVAGFGEFLGYALRLLSGYWADKTFRYWTFTIVGYAINLFAVPLLALANQWWMAASLMILERMGRAIRTPPRDAMLSHACHQVGMGWGFGLQEALDQIGALLGPLIVAIVLYYQGSYQISFAILLVPALMAMVLLLIAWRQYPNPAHLEITIDDLHAKGIHSKVFWLYVIAGALVAAGYADFPLIAYHMQKATTIEKIWIPIIYAIAMGTSGIASLLLGRLYDKLGFSVLVWVTVLSAFFAACVFLGSLPVIIFGALLWGIGVGVHESLMRAVIANMIPKNKRATAYGLFNMFYGFSWFAGSFMMGILYDYSLMALVIFSITLELLAIPFLIMVARKWLITKSGPSAETKQNRS